MIARVGLADDRNPAALPCFGFPEKTQSGRSSGNEVKPARNALASGGQVVASEDAPPIKLANGLRDFHYRGDSHGLLFTVAGSYGLSVLFDDNVPNRHVHFDLNLATFAIAMEAASAVTKTFSVAIGDKVLLVVADTPDNHRLYDPMSMSSFYMSGGESTQDMTEIMTILRTLFDLKFISLNAESNTITLRGPKSAVKGAIRFLEQMDPQEPSVMLDLQVFQLNHTYTRQAGLHLPDTFNLYSLGAAVTGLNAGESVATILAKLQSEDSSILSNPLATFGGGSTFAGLSLDQLSAELSVNESNFRVLDHVELRISQRKDATFKLGLRYPVQTSSYSSITSSLSSSTLQSLGLTSSEISALTTASNSTIPSVSYEDIGLVAKAKATVHRNSNVSLDLEIQLRSLGSTTVNGNPIILNREFKGAIMLKEGESALIAGMVTASDQRSMSGLPALPGSITLGAAVSQQSRQKEDDELLILVTPFVSDHNNSSANPDIWMNN